MLNSNSYEGKPLDAEIAVIPLPRGVEAPSGAHVFMYGNGLNDPSPEANKRFRISWAEKGGKKGYLYDPSHAPHEFLHWMGLSDRHTEVLLLDGTRMGISPRTVTWGRNRNLTFPLANVQSQWENIDRGPYDPMDNAMSTSSSLLTNYQLSILFNNKVEREYHREVLIRGSIVEEIETNGGTADAIPEFAVEFAGGRAYYWNVEFGRRKWPSESTFQPKTIKHSIWGFIGQGFDFYANLFVDPEVHHDRFGERILQNRKEARDAIRANR